MKYLVSFTFLKVRALENFSIFCNVDIYRCCLVLLGRGLGYALPLSLCYAR